jgi:RNA:NAD 2'-phosphotransferase (TPT1/KptA family)
MTRPAVFYHGTSPEAAAVILQMGFLDGERDGICGIWISDRPVGESGGETYLAIAIDRSVLPADAECEFTLEGSTYREWCVPAKVLNEHGTVIQLGDR